MRTSIELTLHVHLGGMDRLEVVAKGCNALAAITSAVCELSNGLAGPVARVNRLHSGLFDVRHQSTYIRSKATVELPDGLAPQSLVSELEHALNPKIIVAEPKGYRRRALVKINKALAGSQYVVSAEIGGHSTTLQHAILATPLRKGVDWRSAVVGTILLRHYRSRRLLLEPLHPTGGDYDSVEVDFTHFEAFVNLLKQEHASEPLYASGRGTINGQRLQIAHVESLRFATRDEGIGNRLEFDF